ncbi:MAG: UDP-N-acetylglucosamine 1-carboxyvinyltransferase [Nitrospinaceae bacterium]|jgi:UDP-N-acetylglucosamine 1-carboxyvinyltransferase|nr:UDP-N-acetylglucosamine 1-carboxyvinyltransferase [Nitrospinaceae bacterium]MDP6656938.1 UDP-N-acetylglucosamine 1-carboxyvinyltransferase [Nitrospinaceae bacterium]MDP6711691.1 UDP-N-acetylglucosamine 1-carboxyvinyltransferase [Nitrospinaceae bacterium]MDP7057886.1 UDP-N-acetylglucosamine 1-carboxyvinyltransferase [Nitrospinaceae bacterium]HAK37502.1 UDP-N-acetylglucosamine 1-carboxyvinyltransferase [Nitrospina sp.]|tara:strand:- start:2369 stop:3622 length:1254 start_codon:yes stop_codon:yes gene_type:complete
MDKIIIEGSQRLKGELEISGAKNAVLPVMAAMILTAGLNKITGVPRVRDVTTMLHLLNDLGGRTEEFEEDRISLDTTDINNYEAPYDLVSTMRASCLVLGPLLARLGKAKVSLPGGCAIGARPLDLHIRGLEAMGAEIKLEKGYIYGSVERLQGTRYYFDTVSVTGTANLMMAATLAEGETVLENVAKEPEVVFLADVLNKCGAKIEGQGTDIMVIQGVSALKPIECRIFPDRIETGTYMIASAITGGDVNIINCIPSQVETLTLKLRQAGVIVEEAATSIRVIGDGPFNGVNLKTQPHPGFATDLQAQFMALMTLARGQSIILETVFENRFMHAAELNRMGANITVQGHTAVVSGVKRLSGAPLMATDLRASASLVLAALAAEGESIISRVYHIDRGYFGMEKKLSRLGAKIRRKK